MSAAQHAFKLGDVIVSERSDKIFFPLFRGVSPIPAPEQLAALVQHQPIGIGLFARPLSQSQKDAWRHAGFDAQELVSFSRERLYRLAPLTP